MRRRGMRLYLLLVVCAIGVAVVTVPAAGDPVAPGPVGDRREGVGDDPDASTSASEPSRSDVQQRVGCLRDQGTDAGP